MNSLKLCIIATIVFVACAKTNKPTNCTTPFQTSLKKAIEQQQTVVNAYSDSASFCKSAKLLYYGEQMEIAVIELNKLKRYGSR